MVWNLITEAEYLRFRSEVLYMAMAGGTMCSGGKFTEYTPHSALNPRHPDLRVEMSNDMKHKRHFKEI